MKKRPARQKITFHLKEVIDHGPITDVKKAREEAQDKLAELLGEKTPSRITVKWAHPRRKEDHYISPEMVDLWASRLQIDTAKERYGRALFNAVKGVSAMALIALGLMRSWEYPHPVADVAKDIKIAWLHRVLLGEYRLQAKAKGYKHAYSRVWWQRCNPISRLKHHNILFKVYTFITHDSEESE